MSVELARDAGPAGEQLLAALAEHLPPGVMGRPIIFGDDDALLDERRQWLGIDEHGAWRVVLLRAGASEVTTWHRGAETSRRARIERVDQGDEDLGGPGPA